MACESNAPRQTLIEHVPSTELHVCSGWIYKNIGFLFLEILIMYVDGLLTSAFMLIIVLLLELSMQTRLYELILVESLARRVKFGFCSVYQATAQW